MSINLKLSEDQQRLMDEKLMKKASAYAKELEESLGDALATNNQNLLLTTEDEENGTVSTTFFYEKATYIRSGVLELAEEITGVEDLTTYDGFSEDLITFEEYVSNNLKDGWFFAYGDNDDTLAIKSEEVTSNE